MNPEDMEWMDNMARKAEAEYNSTRLINDDSNIVEPLPDPIELHNGRGGYDQNKFAKWLINSKTHHYISLNDTGEVLYYDGGVYKPGGDRRIEELIVDAMDGEKITISKAKETVFLVKRRVGHERPDIDSEDGVINLLNGLYNIDTDELSKHTPEYLSVRQMNIEHDEEATCPKIDKFIREIVNEDDIQFIYELFGYTLLSNKRFGTAVFFEGEGANGKSVLMTLMKQFVGDAACSEVTPNEMGGDDKYAIADLFGKALNVVDDLGNNVVDGVGAFKSVITGNPVRGQRKYGHAFAFVPNTLCIFGCNEVPTTTDTSEGYFRRMRIVTFPNKFEGESDNKNLIDELITRDEIAGLFNVSVKAIRDVIVRGEFTGNKTVDEKRREYLTKSNNILLFIYEECDMTDIDVIVEKDELYNQYVLWARDRKTPVKALSHMTNAIKELGGRITRPNDGSGGRMQCYKGIQMRPFRSRDPDGQGSGPGNEPNTNRQQEDENNTSCQTSHTQNHYVTAEHNISNIGENSMTKSRNQHTDSENRPDQTLTVGMTGQENASTDSDQGSEYGDEFLNLVKSSVYKVGYVRALETFGATEVLMEMPKDVGATTELIDRCMQDHQVELKICSIENDKWQFV